MTTSVAEHNTLASPDLEIAVTEAAQARGITLEAERLEQLRRTAEKRQRLNAEPDIYESIIAFDDDNDVKVGRSEYTREYGTTAAWIDFAPILDEDGDIASGTISARPQHATEYALKGIHGLQNYVLLVDVGIIEKPEILYGKTNPEMAIVAERLGMLSELARRNTGNPDIAHRKMRQATDLEIHGTFDEVGERLFSQDTQRFEHLLTRRLAAEKSVGTTALIA